jgi:hypothetical protein
MNGPSPERDPKAESPSPNTDLSERERAKIREEVRYAVIAAREARGTEPPPHGFTRWLSYLSNGFVLLLVGSLITSVLVPYFQRRYENRRQQVALMQECLTQFLLYSNSMWQEYYSVLPLTQRVEIDEKTYLEYLDKMAQIKLKRYDAYARVLALSVVFQDPSVDQAIKNYAVSLNEASAAIDKWLTALYCTPTTRDESPCADFDPSFDAYDEHLKIKSMVVEVGNNVTDNVAAMLVKHINQQ